MEEKIKCDRQSNFELLRIITMMMLVAFHIICCVASQLKSPNSYEIIDASLFHNPVFYKRLLIAESVTSLGKMGIQYSCYYVVIAGPNCGGYNHYNKKLEKTDISDAFCSSYFDFKFIRIIL